MMIDRQARKLLFEPWRQRVIASADELTISIARSATAITGLTAPRFEAVLAQLMNFLPKILGVP